MNHRLNLDTAGKTDAAVDQLHTMATAGHIEDAQAQLDQLTADTQMTADQWYRAGQVYEILASWEQAVHSYKQADLRSQR